MLDGGRVGGRSGKRLLSEESFHELFTPQTIAPYEMYPTTRITRPHWMTYGLGWFQQDYRGQALDFHTGSIDGMVAIHGLVRDEGLGVYVLGNLDHAELRHAIMYTVIDRYAGRRDHDWSAEFLKLYDGLRSEADQERATEERRSHRRDVTLSASREVRRHLQRAAPWRGQGRGRRRRIAAPGRLGLRRPARALALQHVPREVGGHMAGTRAGDVRPGCRGQAPRARD